MEVESEVILIPSQVKQTGGNKTNGSVKKRTSHNKRNGCEGKNNNKAKTSNRNKKRESKNGDRRKNVHNSWRKYIRRGMVDPISLEPLVKLPYPPFALAVSEPYTPIEAWPRPPMSSRDELSKEQQELQRQTLILEEQWGKNVTGINCDEKDSIASAIRSNEKTKDEKNNEQIHLFDGKVLAFYLVSQLQFIDPLNRRDLTREEVKNLDDYLKRHRIKQTSVLEAYDNRGVNINTAGISGQTSQGRAQILQRQAQELLNSLFQHNTMQQNQGNNGRSRSRGRRSNRQHLNNRHEVGNRFSRQYEAHENIDSLHDVNNIEDASVEQSWNTEGGIFNGDGMVIIDDNVNPGMRGVNDISTVITSTDATPYHQQHQSNFPALSASHNTGNTTVAVNTIQPTSSKNKKVSKTLATLGKLVKKTDPKEIEKHKKAREEMLRKMELDNLPFEEYVRRMDIKNQTVDDEVKTHSHIISLNTLPTENQLQRNKILANALGVVPSTTRTKKIGGGWARPTSSTISIDEFGKELNKIEYPDDLVVKAKERMTELLKLEKKWIEWLSDDNAASCSLKKMDRATRSFVHQYSDYWNIKTQSYDPEPNRYIHCVKLIETYAPRPLLSDAAKCWQGSASNDTKQLEEFVFSSTRQFPKVDNRVPLKLSSRSIPFEAKPSMTIDKSTQEENPLADESADRFSSLLAEQERTKLNLHPRTKPLELPPFQPIKTVEVDEKRRKQEENKIMKKIRDKERKQKVLEAAFASDNESSSSDSEWDIGDAVYSGSEED